MDSSIHGFSSYGTDPAFFLPGRDGTEDASMEMALVILDNTRLRQDPFAAGFYLLATSAYALLSHRSDLAELAVGTRLFCHPDELNEVVQTLKARNISCSEHVFQRYGMFGNRQIGYVSLKNRLTGEYKNGEVKRSVEAPNSIAIIWNASTLKNGMKVKLTWSIGYGEYHVVNVPSIPATRAGWKDRIKFQPKANSLYVFASPMNMCLVNVPLLYDYRYMPPFDAKELNSRLSRMMEVVYSLPTTVQHSGAFGTFSVPIPIHEVGRNQVMVVNAPWFHFCVTPQDDRLQAILKTLVYSKFFPLLAVQDDRSTVFFEQPHLLPVLNQVRSGHSGLLFSEGSITNWIEYLKALQVNTLPLFSADMTAPNNLTATDILTGTPPPKV
jgi:hypothetical protein